MGAGPEPPSFRESAARFQSWTHHLGRTTQQPILLRTNQPLQLVHSAPQLHRHAELELGQPVVATPFESGPHGSDNVFAAAK